MLGISFVTMLVAFDQTVVGTALPTIVAELRGIDLYAWVATSYLLTSVITVPIFGRLGDNYGRKPFVIASIVVFTAASALCGMAGSMSFLVAARVLQGIGGGMLVGTAFACVPDLFPDSMVRLRWQVLMSTAFGIANAIGPSLGGFLTQFRGWRSVFYVNLPFGLLSLFFVIRYLPHLRHAKHEGKMRLDWPGALLVIAVLAGLALWRWEKRIPHALLPTDMFANRSLAMLFSLAVLAGFSMFSLLFQGGFSMSPKAAGVVITPLVVFITIGSILNGRIVTRIPSPNAMLPTGFALLALACAGVALSSHATPQAVLLAVMVAGGIGLGFVLPNLTVFVQQTAGREHLGIATALLQSLRMVGGMIGTALTGTLVTQMYAGGVREALGGDRALQWFGRLSDPQILIDREAQARVVAELTQQGHPGAQLLEAARASLVGAIHLGIAIGAVVAVVAVWQSRRVPPIRLRSKIELAVVAE